MTLRRIAFIFVPAMLASAQQSFRAEIPKFWDEEAMRTLEVLLATPEVSPRHLPAERYYAIPEYTIYKPYPRHDPGGKSDAEYFAWLREQEPVIVKADAESLVAKPDWIAAGKAVFDWPTVFAAAESAVEANRLVIRVKGKIEFGTANCSSCHTRKMDDGTEIPGAQMNLPRAWQTARPPTERDFAGFRQSRGATI